MKKILGILATTAFCFPVGFVNLRPAQASFVKDTLGATGSLRSSYWSEDKRFTSDQNFWVGSAWLTLRPEEVLGTKLYADGFVQGEDLTRGTYGKGDLRELFLERSFGDFDFRVGRQIIVWGRADKVNPTDNLSVRDYRRLMTDDEDQRTGITSAQLTYNFSTYRLKALWMPEWRSPGFPLPQVGGGINWLDQKPSNPENQFALKLDQSGGGSVDWSVSYFHGFGKIPGVVPVPKPGGVDLALVYPKFDALGLDFASSFGEWGLRGETAYTLTGDRNGTDPLVLNPFLFTVLGVERSVNENLNLNLQYLNRYTQNFQDPFGIADPNTRQVAVQAAITAQQLVKMNHGLSFRPSYKMWNETLTLETAWIHWFTTGDHLVRPQMSYAVNDQLKLVAAGEIYRGSAATFFGRIKAASTGVFEAKLSF